MKRALMCVLILPVFLGAAGCASDQNAGNEGASPTATALPATPTVAVPVEPEAMVTWVAFASERDGNLDIYRLIVEEGRLSRLVGHPAADYDPAWSPEGSRMVFVSNRSGNRDLYMLEMGSGEVTRLTRGGSDNFQPAWSGDGERITFVSDRNGGWDIYIMRLATGEIVQVTEDESSDYEPAWSPDGERLVFVSEREGNPDVYVMEATGGRPQRLTNNQGVDKSPAWSPDGETIAFVSDRDGAAQVYLMSDRGRDVQLVNGQAGQAQDFPVWGEGGLSLFYSQASGDLNWELYSAALGSGNVLQITDHPASDSQASVVRVPQEENRGWFTAPNFIVGEDENEAQSLGVYSVEGTETLWLGFNAAGIELGTSWRQIWRHTNGYEVVVGGFWEDGNESFQRVRFDVPGEFDEGVWHVSLLIGGRLVQRVSVKAIEQDEVMFLLNRGGDLYLASLDGAVLEQVTSTPEEEWGGVLSPGRERIAFVREGNMFVVEIENGEEVQLTEGGNVVTGPSWAPNGIGVAYVAEVEGEGGLYIVAANGGAPQEVIGAGVAGIRPSWLPGGERVAYVGSGDGGVYVFDLQEGEEMVLEIGDESMEIGQLYWAFDSGLAVYSFGGELYSFDIETGQGNQLTFHPADERFVEWVDGQRFIFESNRSGEWMYYLYDFEDGEVRQLISIWGE